MSLQAANERGERSSTAGVAPVAPAPWPVALAISNLGRFARPALVEGAVGVIVASRLQSARLAIAVDHTTGIAIITEPSPLREVVLTVLE